MTDHEKFVVLRKYVFGKIKACLDSEDDHHKSYEGAFSINEYWPNYFEAEEDMLYTITLDCYVFGPNRHYSWSGGSLREVIDKADKEIRSWD
jgi:hypothetical protein